MAQAASSVMTVDDILALEKRRFAAMCAGDLTTLNELLHAKLTYTHSNGIVDTKETYTNGVREKLWNYQSIRTSKESVSIIGDTALVLSRLEIDVLIRGTPKFVDSLALTVWVRDAGRWQVAAVHSTPHPAN